MAARTLGTADVARALGVSVSTVKRWIDDGILPAQRSGGGHRRLRGEDVVRAVRNHRLPFADITSLLHAEAPSRNLPRLGLLRALKGGDQHRVRQLLGDAHRRGTTMSEIADDLVAPAMHAIGAECASGALDIGEEHRATHLCLGALHEIKAVMLDRVTIADSQLAIGGAPEGDPYMLANLLAELVLLEDGWKVMNLGPNTPMSAFATAVRRWRPALVWLSITHLANRGRFIREFTEFSGVVQRISPAIILGGQALSRGLQDVLPCNAVGIKMVHLSQFARSRASARSATKSPRPRSARD